MSNPTITPMMLLQDELSKRWNTPLGHISFLTFLIVAIVGLGALGIWVEIIRAFSVSKYETDNILTAIYTYFPAIAAGSVLQMLMDAKSEKQQFLRSFCVLSGFVVAVLTVPYINGLKSCWAYLFGIIGIFSSVWLWWIANGCNPSFLDIDPNDSLGANPKSNPAGSTSGFTI